jgi:F-type H+-transporting ATPase subunit gamma
MPTLKEIRRRIRSVSTTQKTTNALQLVAASKMRRAQARALAARPYAERMRTVLGDLASQQTAETDEPLHPLLAERPQAHVTLVVVSPSRGLCGGLPHNLNRAAAAFLLDRGTNTEVVAVGKKGRDFVARMHANLVAEFIALGDYPTLAETLPISRLVIDDYTAGHTDAVYLIYPQFISTVTQRPAVFQILPVQPPEGEAASSKPADYIFEPSPAAVLNELLPRYVEMQIYNAILENSASFQSAQMVAMRNATDAARDLVASLTLEANKARQDQITRELLDLVGGTAALTG